MNGFFGNMFDFNHDGKLDGFEKATDFAMFTSLIEDEEAKTVDLDELEFMDADERREALENAGLDPDDYDF